MSSVFFQKNEPGNIPGKKDFSETPGGFEGRNGGGDRLFFPGMTDPKALKGRA